jgi:hypothetical protein
MNPGFRRYLISVLNTRLMKLIRLYEQRIPHFIFDHILRTLPNHQHFQHPALTLQGFLYFTTHTKILHQGSSVHITHELR